MTTRSVVHTGKKGIKKVSAFKLDNSAKPASWSIADLGAFYIEHKSELLAHANRILKDSARSEEVIQDALVKFMLAAPELASEAHAISYLHRAIENLCMDIFRIEGRRPNLVVMDDATAEIESSWQQNPDHADLIAAADDAAIVRQALSMLSPAERTALVMWEMDGRSTSEIAKELGIKESAVRHTVSRARTSLRRILSELVIDEARGLTALDLLSTTYKKASEITKKSGRVAMSLVLLISAFLGFNSMTGSESIQTVINTQVFENSGVKAETVSPEIEEVVEVFMQTKNLPQVSEEEAMAELEFLNAQLSSAAIMLETLQLIEGKE